MKQDHTHFDLKLKLRLYCVSEIDKRKINVLDCFAGRGVLWNKIKEKTNKEIEVTSIEQISEKNKIALVGNNVKYLKSINLNKYDIIDLDAYGFPIEQLDIIFSRKYRGIIIVTAIQTLYGNLPNKMLFKLGYTKSMINKCRTLFCRNGIEKLKNYLYLNGVKEIEGYFVNRKNYFKFKIN